MRNRAIEPFFRAVAEHGAVSRYEMTERALPEPIEILAHALTHRPEPRPADDRGAEPA